MTAAWLSKTRDGYRIAVQVSPNAKKSEIADASGEALRIRLQAQPIDGKANEALIQFLGKKLKTPKKNITITHGLSGKKKLLEIVASGLEMDEFEARLLSA